MLVTNGFFFDRHPELPQTLLEINCRLEVSQHGTHAGLPRNDSAKRSTPSGNGEKTIPASKSRFGNRIVAGCGSTTSRTANRCRSTPNLHAAYRICMQKTCTQLFRGMLWKCPALAYFGTARRSFESAKTSPHGNCFETTRHVRSDVTDDELQGIHRHRKRFPNVGSAQVGESHFVILIQLSGVSFDDGQIQNAMIAQRPAHSCQY